MPTRILRICAYIAYLRIRILRLRPVVVLFGWFGICLRCRSSTLDVGLSAGCRGRTCDNAVNLPLVLFGTGLAPTSPAPDAAATKTNGGSNQRSLGSVRGACGILRNAVERCTYTNISTQLPIHTYANSNTNVGSSWTRTIHRNDEPLYTESANSSKLISKLIFIKIPVLQNTQ